jgi:hypothetical protein
MNASAGGVCRGNERGGVSFFHAGVNGRAAPRRPIQNHACAGDVHRGGVRVRGAVPCDRVHVNGVR